MCCYCMQLWQFLCNLRHTCARRTTAVYSSVRSWYKFSVKSHYWEKLWAARSGQKVKIITIIQPLQEFCTKSDTPLLESCRVSKELRVIWLLMESQLKWWRIGAVGKRKMNQIKVVKPKIYSMGRAFVSKFKLTLKWF